MDLGVHNKLDIEQEEFCFDIAYDDEGASLLVNSNEQMIAEKLKSLLKFGTLSSRYKDVFDIYYLSQHVNKDVMRMCFKTYIFDDPKMRENDLNGVLRRLSLIFKDKLYVSHLNSTDINWLEEDIDVVIAGIIAFIKKA